MTRYHRILWASLLPLIASGCVMSAHPLSEPAAAELDERLFGIWQSTEDSREGSTLVIIGKEANVAIDPDGGEIEPGLMRMLVIDLGRSAQDLGTPATCRMFATQLGDSDFLNCYLDYFERYTPYGWLSQFHDPWQRSDERDDQTDPSALEQEIRRRLEEHSRFYMFFKYRVDGDRLELTRMDPRAVAELVDDGTLSGSVFRRKGLLELPPDVKLDESSADLAAFLRDGGDSIVFPERNVQVFERIRGLGPPARPDAVEAAASP